MRDPTKSQETPGDHREHAMSDDQMLAEHKKTFDGFVKISTICTVAVAVLLLLMAAFLV